VTRVRAVPNPGQAVAVAAGAFALGVGTVSALLTGELPLALATVAAALVVLLVLGWFSRALDDEQDPDP
jgi:membrane protein implicated in regulation of membrane protease activity